MTGPQHIPYQTWYMKVQVVSPLKPNLNSNFGKTQKEALGVGSSRQGKEGNLNFTGSRDSEKKKENIKRRRSFSNVNEHVLKGV